MTQNSDAKFISYALNLAKKNLGLTAPNPVVGCVIVKNNEIISTGVTAPNGRPHGEIIAINKILHKENGQQLLENATLYVTLEPCSHFGQTSPCANEIIKNKISRVVIASQDPDKRVNGKGIQILQDAGIEVVTGIMTQKAQALNKGFFTAKGKNRPYVTLKIATSLDGKIATKTYDSKWITSEKARFFSHHLRATNDAIMVGSNTVKKDNPTLNCRIPGLENHSPTRVIVAGKISFETQLNIFQTANILPTIIVTHQQDLDDKKLQDLGVKILFCEATNGKIILQSALEKLCQIGINSIVIEGGQNLATQFLQANLVDELIWIRNKKIIGDDGISGIGALGFSKISHVINHFTQQPIQILEEDIIETYTRNMA